MTKLFRIYENIITEQTGCPPATQDIDINLKNRNKAFKDYLYGPADPRPDLARDIEDIDFAKLTDDDIISTEGLQESPNSSYWAKLVEIYNADSIDAIIKQRCGNCAAFDVTSTMKDCIEKGIGDETDPETIVEAGELGYCQFLKFKCAAARTCQSWVSGGPITDEKKAAADDEA